MKSVGDCSTSTDVGEPAMQIPFLDLFGRIETAERLGAEARQVIGEYSANASSYII